MDVQTGKPVCTIDGYVIVQVARSRKDSENSGTARRLCFDLGYKVDPSLVDQAVTDSVLQPDAALGPTARQAEIIDDVEMMCYLYIKRFWDHVYTQDAAIRETVAAHAYHGKYANWIKYQLDKFEAGLIPHAKAVWQEHAASDEYISEMEAKLLGDSAEGNLVVNVGRKLPEILAGEADALELLFNDQLVENVYRSGVGAELDYDRMVAYIDAAAHKNPALRIMEIGAGTRGATRPVLECLNPVDGGSLASATMPLPTSPSASSRRPRDVQGQRQPDELPGPQH